MVAMTCKCACKRMHLCFPILDVDLVFMNKVQEAECTFLFALRLQFFTHYGELDRKNVQPVGLLQYIKYY